MIEAIRHFFRPRPIFAPAEIPPGQRVYAIGDIHGQLDLFAALTDAIERDDAARSAADTTIVLLGDLVDRGARSAGVIAHARALQERRAVRIIAGNHEEMFLRSFDEVELLPHFLRAGGYETILSYPIDRNAFRTATISEAQAMMVAAVPEADIAFMRGFEHLIEIGGYAFVHAGVRPGIALANQSEQDLRWIREPFLSHGGDHGRVVVHGHTITSEAELLPNRIGIDTGAYMSGKLTALGLEGSERWLIQTDDSEDGRIATTTEPA